jgi:hypothetical protein
VSDQLSLRTAFRQTILPPLRAAGFWDYTPSYGGTHMGVIRASCIKPYPDRLMLAVQFIDDRANHHSLVCRAWLAPWHSGDDSLERLQIGLCMIVFDCYEFNEAAAAGIVRRIQALDRLVPSLRETVLAELAEPPLPSFRAQVYRAERRVVEGVLNGVDVTVTEAWQAVLADMAAFPVRQFTAKAVNERVRQFATAHREVLARLALEAEVPHARERAASDRDLFAGPFHVEAYYTELVRRSVTPPSAT